MTKTGVFATADEIENLKAAVKAPLIALNYGMPASPASIAHSYAIAHGLPEVSGYYGIDLQTGEFVSA
jgi:hypothetical protein